MANPLEFRWPPQFLRESDAPPERYAEDPNSKGPNSEGNSRSRMTWLLIGLFIMTMASTFWVGVVEWSPMTVVFENGAIMLIRQMTLENVWIGTIFSLSLLGILTAHEFGHYLMARYYGVKATPPIFIPFPFNPFGTCGALIAMQAGQADRKQIFDIGIAGPLAGLVVAIPMIVAGLTTNIVPGFQNPSVYEFGMPIGIQWLSHFFQPDFLKQSINIPNSRMNPFLMAAWAGLLVTGVNMVPMSQLDGGHVAFGLLGKRSYLISYFAFGLCIAYIIFLGQWSFILMLFLVSMMGIKHPPSSDDSIELGWARQLLGWISLSIPILCVPANPLQMLGG